MSRIGTLVVAFLVACILVGWLTAACMLGGCSASFVGPATQGEPERVRCAGGGTCPANHMCRPGGLCAFAGWTGAAPDAGR